MADPLQGTSRSTRSRSQTRNMNAKSPDPTRWMTRNGNSATVYHPPYPRLQCPETGCPHVREGDNWAKAKLNMFRHLKTLHAVEVTKSTNICRRCTADMGGRPYTHKCAGTLNSTTAFQVECGKCGKGYTKKLRPHASLQRPAQRDRYYSIHSNSSIASDVPSPIKSTGGSLWP